MANTGGSCYGRFALRVKPIYVGGNDRTFVQLNEMFFDI